MAPSGSILLALALLLLLATAYRKVLEWASSGDALQTAGLEQDPAAKGSPLRPQQDPAAKGGPLRPQQDPAAKGSPLRPQQYRWLNISHVRPRGWLLVQERIQAEGLGGHLQDFYLNGSQWMGGSTPLAGSHSLETVPYWLYGIVPLASQLEDPRLLDVVRRYVSAILDGQQSDGWMGPWNTSNPSDGSHDPWPRYRLLSVLAEYADVAEDQRTITAMHKLAHRIHSELLNMTETDMRNRFGWAHARWHELVGNVQYLIDQDPGNEFNDQGQLMELIKTVRKKGLDWGSWYKVRLCENATDTECFPCRDTHSKTCLFASGEYFCEHGVNVAQSFKFWALEWRSSLNPEAPVDALNGLKRMDYCHGQPGGVYSAHEVSDGIEPNRGTETCHVVEAMNSYAELFATFGDLTYLERLEAAAFNRLPAPYFNGSMWAMQYFHQTSTYNFCNGYALPFECCPSNGNQGWPRFTAHLYAKHQNGIAAVLYAPSSMETVLQDGGQKNRISISLDTEYPFGEVLNFSLTAEQGFPFWLRIPSWAVGASVKVDEGPPLNVVNATFHQVQVKAGRTLISLVLPMHVRVQPEQAGGVSVHAGALLFALDLSPKEEVGAQCFFPPRGCAGSLVSEVDGWRRALVLDKSDPLGGGLRVERLARELLESAPPFAAASVPVRIKARGRVVPPESWPTVSCTSMEQGCHDCVGPVPRDPPVDGPEVELTLLPFGATDVRIGVMPAVWRQGEGGTTETWS